MVSADAKRARPWTAERRGKEESKKVYASALAQYIPHSCVEHIAYSYIPYCLAGEEVLVVRRCTSAMVSVLLVTKFGTTQWRVVKTGDSDLAANRVLIRPEL